jgi:cytochrome c biogenesis protein ResB
MDLCPLNINQPGNGVNSKDFQLGNVFPSFYLMKLIIFVIVFTIACSITKIKLY